jgi:penicillin-binding protein 1A
MYAVSGIFGLCVRAMLAVALIVVTTLLIFACIFTVYVKTNMSAGLDLSLDDYSQSLSSTIYYTDPESGKPVDLVTVQSTEYRIWLEYEEIPLDVEHALVAIEDKRFYKHYGVDWYRTAGAFVTMFMKGQGTFGGSTITQQLIKNVTGNDEATIARKFQEIFTAMEFERKYNKDEILQWYLNVVYFGKGTYGIGAAADKYFGRDVGALTVAEIASLIAIPNNPSVYNPYTHPENNKKRQEDILEQMYLQEYISEAEYNRAKAQRLVFKQGVNTVYDQEIYTWFEEAVISEVVADLAEQRGISETAARMLLSSGGYSIYSTLNPAVQAVLDEVYLDVEGLPKTTGTEKQLQSAMIIVDPYTGYTQGLVGGVGEKTGNLWLNRATSDLGRRPPGSSIKPISVYAPAMEAGLITPNTKIDDSGDVVLKGKPDWLPRNDDRDWLGVINLRTAIVRSRNTIAAQVLDWLTPDASYRFMTDKLGFKLDPADRDYAPLSIGQLTYGATPREMASAYTMFVNNGVRVEAITYTKIFDRNGTLVFENKPVQTVAISETTAYWMTNILHDAAVFGTGAEANLGSMPTAGKTGTAGESKDRWFCGFTPYYVGVTWCGYDQPEPIRMAGRGNPSSQIWKRVMGAIHEELEVKDFTTPENTYQPPVPGINEVEYTVNYRTEAGTLFFTETKEASVGKDIELTAPEYENFEIVGPASQTLTLNENPERNVVTFVYRYVSPEPSPTPTPAPPTPPPIWMSPPPSYEPWASPDEPPPTDLPATPAEQ